LFAHIARYVVLTPAEVALLEGYLSHQRLARHDFLLVEGFFFQKGGFTR
jgi:hypothetical protein